MKFPVIVKCDLDESDYVEIEDVSSDGNVVLYGYRYGRIGTSVHMDPQKARRLAKAIKKAAKRAERSS